jgi:transposase
VVVAPSKIPRVTNDRIKNDRRDAVTLARLLRADELAPVWIPDEGHEASAIWSAHDMLPHTICVRCGNGSRLSCCVMSVVMRVPPGKRCTRSGSAASSSRTRRSRLPFKGHLSSAAHAAARRDELEGQIRELLPGWSLRPIVDALQCLRGIALITAVTLVAEIGDIRRFQRPAELMAYL